MTIVVACRIPSGLLIDHAIGAKPGEPSGPVRHITINGPSIGIDPMAVPLNGGFPDDPNRINGFGLTTLEGDDADTFLDWQKVSKFVAFDTGDLIVGKSLGDVRAETAKAADGGQLARGMDPDKDLPAGVTTDKVDKKDK